MKRDLIKTIHVDKANLEHIAKTGNINGTLLIEIERVMTEYSQQQANGVSANTQATEAQTLEEHEVLTEVCNCSEPSECHKINDTWLCSECNKPLVQTC